MTKARRRLLDQAVHLLIRGYQEEMSLYRLVRDISQRQVRTLDGQDGLRAFCELHRRKEQVLDLIGRIESEMRVAKEVVLSHSPTDCPHRHRLVEILQDVQGLIRAVREAEELNADRLQRVPA